MSHAINERLRIHYAARGAGPEVLLLHHGFSDSLERWAEAGWVERLAERYRVVTLDARGHGRSSKPHHRAAYEATCRVGDVLAVLDHLGVESVHFGGYSLGGRVGFELARSHPGRVRSLVLGGAHPFAQSLAPLRRALAEGLEGWMRLLERHVGALSAIEGARFRENDLAALRASVARDRPDVSAALSRIRVPTLLFVGAEDTLLAEVQRAACAILDAELVELPGYGHFDLGLRVGAALDAAEAFLASSGPSGVVRRRSAL